jgi:hypothetical protein
VRLDTEEWPLVTGDGKRKLQEAEEGMRVLRVVGTHVERMAWHWGNDSL